MDVAAVIDHTMLVVIMIILAPFFGEPAFGSPKYVLKEQGQLLRHKGIYYVVFGVFCFLLFVFFFCCFAW